MRASSSAIGVAITSAVSAVALYLLHNRHDSCRRDEDENLSKDDIAKPKSGESKKHDTEMMSTSSHEPETPVKAVPLQNVDNCLRCLDPSGAVIPPTSDVTHSPTSVIHCTKKIHGKAEMPPVPLKYKQGTGMQTGNSAEVAPLGITHLLIPRSSSLSSMLPKSNSLPSLNSITTSRRNNDVPVGSVSTSKVSEQSEGFIISLEDLVMCNELMLQRADEDRLYGSYYDYRDDMAAEPTVRSPRRHSDACLLVGDC
jgi:hypothetical protein